MRFILAKCLWGEAYVRTMLTVNLPSLLAPGNLPAIARAHEIEHVLYTTRRDAETITAAPVYRRLAALVPTRFEWIDDDDGIGYGATIRRMNAIHNRILLDCRDRAATWLFDQPDHVWADGALGHLAARTAAGARCCVFPAIRTVAEAVIPALARFRDSAGAAASGEDSGEAIIVPSGDLVRIAIEHMHIHDIARVWGPGTGTVWPHHISWRAGPDALLRRAFFLQPFTVAPTGDPVEAERSVDMHYIDRAFPDPGALDFITDTDDFFVLEVSTRFHVIDPNPHPLTVPSVAAWAAAHTGDYQRACFAAAAVRIHAGPVPERRWRRLERHSARVHAAIEMTIRLHRLQAWLQANGHSRAARLLGRVLRDARALGRHRLSGAVTVLLPPDHALAAFDALIDANPFDAATAAAAADCLAAFVRPAASPETVPAEGGERDVNRERLADGFEIIHLSGVPAGIAPSGIRP